MLVDASVAGRSISVFERKARHFYLFAPGVTCRELDPPLGVPEDAWLFLELASVPPEFERRSIIVLDDPDERLVPHVRAAHALLETGETIARSEALGHAMIILAQLRTASRRGHEGTVEDPSPLEPLGVPRTGSLLSLVDAHVEKTKNRNPSLERIAREVGMSVSSLSHRFKLETGMTVMARVRWLRLREARRRLCEAGSTAKQVAAKLGFASASHLSNTFRSATGMTPSDFQRKVRSAIP
jgi:AraC-like DNA-binding protein